MVFFILPSLSAQDLDIDPEGISLRDDISRGLMTRAIWKRPCINLFITYFARADNTLLPRRQITRCKLCFYYTCKFSVISIKYVIIKFIGNLDIFLFDLTDWYCQYQLNDTNTGKYQSVWRLIPKKKPITFVLKVLTDIITARPIGLTAILVIMSVLTLKKAVILYLLHICQRKTKIFQSRENIIESPIKKTQCSSKRLIIYNIKCPILLWISKINHE